MSRSFLHRAVSLAFVLLIALAQLPLPSRADAQDGKGHKVPTWNDAPLVPRHRSEADWLIDVGRNTYEEVYGPFPTHEYNVGDVEQFFPLGGFGDTGQSFFLGYRSAHAYFWFESGVRADPAELEATARFFEERIWPLNTAIYGTEWNPGIDGDPRLHILSQEFIEPGVVGAFNPEDECPQFVCPQSNQREIIYISLGDAPLGSEEFLTTLAHEYQHLIQHYVDGNEARWVNEGLSQLAEHLNGFHPRYVGGDNMRDFLAEPDHYLDGWAQDGWEMGRYYGASYLFMVYLYERFGLDYIQRLASSDYDGLAGVYRTLIENGHVGGVDDVFADWILANYLDDPYVGDGHYYYQTLDLPTTIQPERMNVLDTGYQHTGAVSQYGADYLLLDKPGTYDISFDGSDQVALLGAAPTSGDWMWWSYNNSAGASHLTGAFDFSQLQTATLEFNAWWDTEEEYDWFQVLASRDGGRSWEIVGGDHAQKVDPSKPGLYYSGHSARWVDEKIDLSAYVGGPVLIRFEYLTDNSGVMPGVALDDIRIPELFYLDDVENVLTVWNAEGFLRIPQSVPQNWTVALVQQTPGDHAVVNHLALDELHTGHVTITVPEGSTATLVIGAMASFAADQGTYKVAIQRQG